MTKRRQYCPQGHDTFVVGRDQSSRCLECKRLGLQANWAARRAEEEAAREAERAQKRAAADKQRKAERARILKARGPEAKKLRWEEAFTESLRNDGPGLCQWQDEVDGRYEPRQCFEPADESYVYCGAHNRQLDRRQEAKRKAEAAAYEAQVSAYKPPREPPRTDTARPEPEPDPPRVVPLPRRPFEGTWYPVE